MTKKATKLPIAAQTPADRQRELAVKPVGAGASRPEFPTRGELYRKAGLLGGAALLAGGMACGSAPPQPAAPANAAPVAATPAPVAPTPTPTPPAPDTEQLPPQQPPATADSGVKKPLPPDGSVDGQELPAEAPVFKVTRAGGGIGPAEDMWDPGEVDAYLAWQMAHEGKLGIQRNVKLTYDGVDVLLAGFDADKNIGFVYFDKTTGSEDRLSKDLLRKIDDWAKAGKLAILVVDIKKNPDTATLKGKVVKFFAATKKHPPAAGPLDGLVVKPAG